MASRSVWFQKLKLPFFRKENQNLVHALVKFIPYICVGFAKLLKIEMSLMLIHEHFLQINRNAGKQMALKNIQKRREILEEM